MAYTITINLVYADRRSLNEVRNRVIGNFSEYSLRTEADKIDWEKITFPI